MRRSFIVQAAAVLILSASAHAEGYVSGTYVTVEDSDTDVTSIDGRYILGDHVMLDGGYSYADGDAEIFRIGAHALLRRPEWLLGAYAGYEEVESSGLSFHDWTFAGEGQYFMDRATVSALVTYGETGDRPFGAPLEQWTAGGDVRYFITDNFGVRASAAWMHEEVATMDQEGAILSIGAEYQFDDSPVSLTAGYRYTESLFQPLDSYGISIKWNFGDGTLLQRDHAGARLTRPKGVVETFAGGITLD